jgi:predicted ribosomally synthesized peptide with SipW-like signal peptide
MKKILMSLLSISLVASAAVSATQAYFSDTETSTGNTFAAGKIDLELGNSVALPFSVPNVVPGESGEGKVTLTNVAGSISGKLNVSLENLVKLENGIIESEEGLNGEYTPDSGELGMFLNFVAFVDVNKNGNFDSGDVQLAYNGALPYTQINYFAGWKANGLRSWNNVVTLGGGESVDLIIKWEFPTESQDGNYSQNISMTDSLEFDLVFGLEQVTP